MAKDWDSALILSNEAYGVAMVEGARRRGLRRLEEETRVEEAMVEEVIL